jgi:hypothetical protein
MPANYTSEGPGPAPGAREASGAGRGLSWRLAAAGRPATPSARRQRRRGHGHLHRCRGAADVDRSSRDPCAECLGSGGPKRPRQRERRCGADGADGDGVPSAVGAESLQIDGVAGLIGRHAAAKRYLSTHGRGRRAALHRHDVLHALEQNRRAAVHRSAVSAAASAHDRAMPRRRIRPPYLRLMSPVGCRPARTVVMTFLRTADGSRSCASLLRTVPVAPGRRDHPASDIRLLRSIRSPSFCWSALAGSCCGCG